MELRQEFARTDFGDKRLNKRLDKILTGIGDNIQGSIAECMQTWKDTQGAYRFFANENVILQLGIAHKIEPCHKRI